MDTNGIRARHWRCASKETELRRGVDTRRCASKEGGLVLLEKRTSASEDAGPRKWMDCEILQWLGSRIKHSL